MRLVYRTQQLYLEDRFFFRTYSHNLTFQDVRTIFYVVRIASVDK